MRHKSLTLCAGALCFAIALGAQQKKGADLGFTDTPILPGQKWHVHDPDRPHPHVVTPGKEPGAAPSDAIVLFDGKDLSQWDQHGRGADRAKLVDAQWKVENGYFEVVPGTGDLLTREKFGDCQLHVEWSELPDVRGASQARGNSGVLLMSRYEIQVLDALQQSHLRRRPGGGDLRAVSAAGESGPQAGRVADLRHRVRSAAV